MDVSQELLLETYQKFMRLKSSLKEANKHYLLTEKGKEKKREINKSYVESKKEDTEYRININRKQRERYKRKVEQKKKEIENESLATNHSDI